MPKLSDTWRLALSYLAIIMTLSVVFSAVVYGLVASQLGRPLPPPRGAASHGAEALPAQTQARLDRRDEEARGSVLLALMLLNGAMLLGGTLFSYRLSRRTLAPIEAAFERQSQFVSDASHELRTPLAALMAINEVALRKKSLTPDKARQVMSRTVEEATRLRDLSDSLLGLAQAGKVVGEPHTTSLAQLITEVAQTLAPSAKAKKLRIQQAIPQDVMATIHPQPVRQIITILLDNAIKYSPQHGDITVTAQHVHGRVMVTVRDNGPGIAPEHQARIFERFYRTDTARTRTATAGYGLGLAIAKSLADTYGYRLGVESTPGKGATFTLVVER